MGRSSARLINHKTGEVIENNVPFLPALHRPGRIVSTHHYLEGWNKYRVKRILQESPVRILVRKCWLSWL